MPLKEFKAKLLPELKEINLFLKRNLLSSSLSGEMISSLKGRGIEFEDYRDYSVEDDASRIDWIASKRSQRTLVREYKLEVNFKVFFLIDVSESMLFGSTKLLKCEYAAQVACTFFYGLIQSGNSIGYGLFNENLVKISLPEMGKKKFYNFTKDISNPLIYGENKNIGKAIQSAMKFVEKKSLFIIISDFILPDESWIEFLKILATKNEVIGISIRDPRDYELIDVGNMILEDPFSNDKIYINTKDYSKLYKEYNEKNLRFIKSAFTNNKSSFLELKTTDNYLNKMVEFFRSKGIRWR
ncbi:MAG: DUF58 domain-containing protein [Candidatus Woesearchaeota archaeon]